MAAPTIAPAPTAPILPFTFSPTRLAILPFTFSPTRPPTRPPTSSPPNAAHPAGPATAGRAAPAIARVEHVVATCIPTFPATCTPVEVSASKPRREARSTHPGIDSTPNSWRNSLANVQQFFDKRL